MTSKHKALSYIRRAARVYGFVKTTEHDGHYIRMYKNDAIASINDVDSDVLIDIRYDHDRVEAYIN